MKCIKIIYEEVLIMQIVSWRIQIIPLIYFELWSSPFKIKICSVPITSVYWIFVSPISYVHPETLSIIQKKYFKKTFRQGWDGYFRSTGKCMYRGTESFLQIFSFIVVYLWSHHFMYGVLHNVSTLMLLNFSSNFKCILQPCLLSHCPET